MEKLNSLVEHIADRVAINLRNRPVSVRKCVKEILPTDQRALYYAFYALSANHPVYLRFSQSSLAGSYFLGKCEVERSVLYKTDVRGDELKREGDVVKLDEGQVRLYTDEIISIRHSALVKTLVHNNSHDPENLERFEIINTLALHFANIHGSPVAGCILGPFATVDLSTCHHCVIKEFAYVQAPDLTHETVDSGRVWIKAPGIFEFDFRHDPQILAKYINMNDGCQPQGVLMDFFEERKEDFVPIYSSVQPELLVDVPENAFVSPYAVIKGECTIGEKVLVAQRAYIENSVLGHGANAQEHCYIINSTYEGDNVTAHGGKVIHCTLGIKTFVGFNSFLRGSAKNPVTIGRDCIVMPHTIIDATEPVNIPDESLVWGHITCQKDLELNSVSLTELSRIKALNIGSMSFQGSGAGFVQAFRHRIEHILEENGAYYTGEDNTRGHAQMTQNVAFNILQPYQDGNLKGMCPTISIGPCQIS